MKYFSRVVIIAEIFACSVRLSSVIVQYFILLTSVFVSIYYEATFFHILNRWGRIANNFSGDVHKLGPSGFSGSYTFDNPRFKWMKSRSVSFPLGLVPVPGKSNGDISGGHLALRLYRQFL